jgi:type I restriction enzyme, S subunit
MTDLPPGWVATKLADLAAAEPRAITDGPFGSNLKTSHYTDEGPRVIRLQNIGFGTWVDERAHISPEHYENLIAHSVQEGDLLVASLGTNLPRSCLVPAGVTPAIVKADCIRIRLHPEIDSRYVNFALQRPELKHAVADQVHGVGRPRLGMSGIKALSVHLAPASEQRRIVDAIEEHFDRLDSAAGSVRRAARLLGLEVSGSAWGPLHLAILAEAFAGRLVPQNPDDEPAQALLHRISVERAAHGSTRRRRRVTS